MLDDLESMRDLIFKKMEELLKKQNKKINNKSYLLNRLPEHFRQLLELLAAKEEKEKDSLLISKKPIKGFSCVS